MNFNIVSENFVQYGAAQNDLHGGAGAFPLGVYSSAHAPYHTNNDLYGGAEVVLWQVAQLLIQAGHRVTVIQVGQNYGNREYHGIRVKTIPVHHPIYMARLGITRKFHTLGFFWPWYLDNDVDRVHLHYLHNAFPFGKGDTTGFSHGIDWDCPNYKLDLSTRSLIDRFHFSSMKAIVRYSVAGLRRIAANDSFFLRYIQSELPQHRDKVFYIPNCVDLAQFNPAIPPDEMIAHAYKGKFKVLLPKSLSHPRGTDIAIEAVSLLQRKDVVLLLPHVGPQAIYEDLARRLGVVDQIKFLGHKDHFREMPQLYRAADIVIVPSHCREGTALAALEALACEKPLVVSNVGGLTDIVVDGFNGLICKPDPSSLRDALDSLIHNRDLSCQLAQQGLEWVRRNHNKGLWQRRMLDFFGLQ